MAPDTLASVPWDELEHAYGPAGDVPDLLRRIPKARGNKLQELAEELWSRVLHQGTFYSASPTVARWMADALPEADAEHQEFYYTMLGDFGSSARLSFKAGRAVACCAGGDPVHAEELKQVLQKAQHQAAAALAHSRTGIRLGAASVAGAFPDRDPAVVAALRDRYCAEPEAEVRGAILEGLERTQAAVRDWAGFLRDAAAQEKDPQLLLDLRALEVSAAGAGAGRGVEQELAASFAGAGVTVCNEEATARFFAALAQLGEDREFEGLMAALAEARSDGAALFLAERLLRRVFRDGREGWGERSFGWSNPDGSPPPQPNLARMALRGIGQLLLMKLFPWIFRWNMRRAAQRPKPPGMQKIEFWGVKGAPPAIPDPLEPRQRAALEALLRCDAAWTFRTNLWSLFALPEERTALREWLTGRA